jgi:hypothetical protein
MTALPKRPHRLKSTQRADPLPDGKPLAPYRVPSLPAGKFAAVPGQMAMDLWSDDPDVLVDPAGEEQSA